MKKFFSILIVTLLVITMSLSVFASGEGIIGKTLTLTEEGQGVMEITVLDETGLAIHVIFNDGSIADLNGTYTIEGDIMTINALGGELGTAKIVGDTLIPVEAEETAKDTDSDIPMDDMIDLYEWWQEYKSLEGDTPLEKGVDFFFKHKGDVGGIVAAVVVIVVGAIVIVNSKKNRETTDNVPVICNATINKALAALDTPIKSAEEFIKLVPQLQEKLENAQQIIAKALEENTELKKALEVKIASDAAQSEKLKAVLEYQAEVFADIIAMTALPVTTKDKLLSKYKELKGNIGNE